jgi:hypothetical protein
MAGIQAECKRSLRYNLGANPVQRSMVDGAGKRRKVCCATAHRKKSFNIFIPVKAG